jgi:hypothetical protein
VALVVVTIWRVPPHEQSANPQDTMDAVESKGNYLVERARALQDLIQVAREGLTLDEHERLAELRQAIRALLNEDELKEDELVTSADVGVERLPLAAKRNGRQGVDSKTASQLQACLAILERVRTITSREEIELARRVVALTVPWQQQFESLKAVTLAGARWDVATTDHELQCLNCGRPAPPLPTHCPVCGGNWVWM